MDNDRRSNYSHCKPGHPKAERARAKKGTSSSAAKRPVYAHKNRFQPRPAGRAAVGDTEAHGSDGADLCRKVLPRDCQEARGCKFRDMDRRNKYWNMRVYLGVFGAAEIFVP